MLPPPPLLPTTTTTTTSTSTSTPAQRRPSRVREGQKKKNDDVPIISDHFRPSRTERFLIGWRSIFDRSGASWGRPNDSRRDFQWRAGKKRSDVERKTNKQTNDTNKQQRNRLTEFFRLQGRRDIKRENFRFLFFFFFFFAFLMRHLIRISMIG